MTPARRFLWAIAIIIGLVVVTAFVWRLAGERMIRAAMTPGIAFAESPQAPAPDYALPANWVSPPGTKNDPALWVPEGFSPAPKPAAAVFFVSPTAFLQRGRWNAPLDDAETNERLEKFARMQASAFNGVAEIWIPRTRQATFGTFLKDSADADKALELAYADTARAFDAFLAAHPGDTPIILAGHSQGARHILHLAKARSAMLKNRLVAVYAVGWPVALPADPAAIGLPACKNAAEAGCILSWQSWAADGDLAAATKAFTAVKNLSGTPIGAAKMLCNNPLTGNGGAALPEANAGALFGETLQAKKVGASCAPSGLLLINPAPSDIGPYVLPGGNYHVYDYSLFWANIRADVEARLSTFGAARMAAP